MLGGLSDTLNGGPGHDTAAFNDSTALIKASLALGAAFGQGADDLNGIERAQDELPGRHLALVVSVPHVDLPCRGTRRATVMFPSGAPRCRVPSSSAGYVRSRSISFTRRFGATRR